MGSNSTLNAAGAVLKVAAVCGSLRRASHNRGLIRSAPLKNAIDWASRPPNMWADKAAAIVSAAGGSGGSRSQYHVRKIGVVLDLHFISKPEMFIPVKFPQSSFDTDGKVTDPDIKERLKKVLLSLQAFTLRPNSK